MESSGDFSSPPELDYEGWRGLLRSLCGRYNPEGIEPKAFAGWVRPVTAASLHADVRPLDHPPLHDGSPRPGPPTFARAIVLLQGSAAKNRLPGRQRREGRSQAPLTPHRECAMNK
jgi:hypothetical protein